MWCERNVKNMKLWKKRLFALLLAAVVACSLIPAAFAAGVPGTLAMIPVTGDDTNYAAVIGIACAAVVVIVIAIILGLRKKSDK